MVIARVLLPAGLELIKPRFDFTEGGLDSNREALLELVPGTAAIVADPTVRVDAGLLDAAGEELELVANFAVGFDNIDLVACRERGGARSPAEPAWRASAESGAMRIRSS